MGRGNLGKLIQERASDFEQFYKKNQQRNRLKRLKGGHNREEREHGCLN